MLKKVNYLSKSNPLHQLIENKYITKTNIYYLDTV